MWLFSGLPVVGLLILMALQRSLASPQGGKYINHYASQAGEYQTNRGIAVHVQAIIKGTALLPCDLSAPAPNDTVVLVVWYKDEHTPIYSYDTRGPHSTLAKHWQDGNLDTRAYFRIHTEPSTLSIDNIGEKDEGEYRCRIDYLRSPTKNLRVKLTVIVPPQKPTIIDEKGKEIQNVAGPYEEGGDLKLTCIVTGGKPEPVIKWWRAEKLVESQDTRSGFRNVRSNQLQVAGLQRSDQHATFTCQASNNNISQPMSASATIEIHFRPLSVEILTSNNPLSADRKYDIPCETKGSRPPAKMTWWLDSQELKPPLYNHTQKDALDGNSSTSELTFVPTRLDNDRTLTCRAVNHLVQNGLEEYSLKLNIFYIPILHLTLGSNLNPDDIEEGDDVYFECKVNANPWAYKVLWKHNGLVMQQNQKAGVIISNNALALQGVVKSQAGNYSCVASNVEGDGDSGTVQLKIMYKPICRTDQKRVYGVARHENAKVLCEVESYPPPASFKWAFNNTAETIDVPQTKFQSGLHHSSSTLTYTPVTELDYGTVMCWASNLAGPQVEPCVFHIIAAGKPDPPYNCSILNQTAESLEVDCVEGFDGGQPQFFLLEVYDEVNDALQANVTAKFPAFTVTGLESGKILKMLVYAANGKGRSEDVSLEGFTLKIAEKQTVLSLGTRDQIELAPILGILVGVVTALLLITIMILGAVKIRAAQRDGSHHALRPGFLPVKEKVTLPLRSDGEDLFEKDDKNPDVVPANKDSDYQLGSGVQTPGLNNAVNTTASTASTASAGGNTVANGNGAGTPLEYEMVRTTPLAEAYIAREANRGPGYNHTNPPTDEVTYAELSLARPTTLGAESTTLLPTATPHSNGGPPAYNHHSSHHHLHHQPYGSLPRPTIGRGPIADDPTIYAQIDHSRKYGQQTGHAPPQAMIVEGHMTSPQQPPQSQQLVKSSPLSPVAALFPMSKQQGLYHREVVTVRTPLMGCQQESCV